MVGVAWIRERKNRTIGRFHGLTAVGPSSKADAKVPFGESQMSPGILHWYVAEQTWGLLGL